MTTRFIRTALLLAALSLAGLSNAQPLPSVTKSSQLKCIWVVTPDGAYISCWR